METIVKQITVKITKEEQNRLYDLCDKISDTYVCELLSCSKCSAEICEEGVCPFFKLDDELRNVCNKILNTANEYGPKDTD